MNNPLRLSASRITLLFALPAAALVISHVVLQTAAAYGFKSFVVNLFHLGHERNLPTFYSSAALAFCALISALIGSSRRATGKPDVNYWWGLALCFLFISLDEFVGIHERLIKPIRSALDTSGPLFYAWVIPYSIIALMFGLVYVRFLLRLPRKTATLFTIAGGLFVLGAVGFEMLSGWTLDAFHGGVYANRGPLYIILQTIEETLELTGVVLFLHSALDFAAREGLSVAVGTGPAVLGHWAGVEAERYAYTTDSLVPEAAAVASKLSAGSSHEPVALEDSD